MKSPDHPRTDTTQKDIQWKGQRLVKERLKDPSSAIFGPSYVTEQGTLCGTVNARNSFGGMTGLKGYLVTSTQVLTQEQPGFTKLWKTYCHRKDA